MPTVKVRVRSFAQGAILGMGRQAVAALPKAGPDGPSCRRSTLVQVSDASPSSVLAWMRLLEMRSVSKPGPERYSQVETPALPTHPASATKAATMPVILIHVIGPA